MKDSWLTGWKEIAAYINKHVDTAIKYHKEYGMPVRRDPGGGAFAFKHEIDYWASRFSELSDNVIHKIE